MQRAAGTRPAPSDAVVLFDGKDLSHWRGRRGRPADWNVADGAMVIKPGAGEITSTDEFGDCQLHLEFAAPEPARGSDQGRGNSGVMFFARYEIQVLDSFENITYADGQAAAIYGQFPPLVNASRPPGQWQSYDIVFTAPRFKPDGSLESPAYVTMLHNGVLVQNHTAVIGAMAYRAVGKYTPHGPKGAHPPTGPWQPCAVSEYLGEGGRGLRFRFRSIGSDRAGGACAQCLASFFGEEPRDFVHHALGLVGFEQELRMSRSVEHDRIPSGPLLSHSAREHLVVGEHRPTRGRRGR